MQEVVPDVFATFPSQPAAQGSVSQQSHDLQRATLHRADQQARALVEHLQGNAVAAPAPYRVWLTVYSVELRVELP